jgi:hypothetical protein
MNACGCIKYEEQHNVEGKAVIPGKIWWLNPYTIATGTIHISIDVTANFVTTVDIASPDGNVDTVEDNKKL